MRPVSQSPLPPLPRRSAGPQSARRVVAAHSLFPRVPTAVGAVVVSWLLITLSQVNAVPPMRLFIWSALLMGAVSAQFALWFGARGLVRQRHGAMRWLEDHIASCWVLGSALAATVYFLMPSAYLPNATLIPVLVTALAIGLAGLAAESLRSAFALLAPVLVFALPVYMARDGDWTIAGAMAAACLSVLAVLAAFQFLANAETRTRRAGKGTRSKAKRRLRAAMSMRLL